MSPEGSHIPFVVPASYPVRAGNRVRPLIDGEAAFRRIGAAVEAARHSVWVTVAFVTPDFRMPEDRGSLFDLLDRAGARGLDTRVIFWRPDAETPRFEPRTFSGTPAQRAWLGARDSRFAIRWDRAAAGFCQHQKIWLVDAGTASEIAFVGGINLNPRSVVAPGHGGIGENHDAYVELAGPAATDVQHNFVQRWNGASERAAEDGCWGPAVGDLPFPARASMPRGDALVQIQRTVHAGRYDTGQASPGGTAFDIAAGERSILVQYQLAIAAARRSIYIENQALEVDEIVAALEAALAREVEVVVLLPAEPEEAMRAARRNPQRQAFYAARSALGRHPRFTLAGIAAPGADDTRHSVYVHAKLMLVDDAWACIGSGNLHTASLFGNTEMNAAFWDAGVVHDLRTSLLSEHLGLDTAGLDDRAAFSLYRRIAGENRRRREAGDPAWQGLAFSLDPASYGE